MYIYIYTGLLVLLPSIGWSNGSVDSELQSIDVGSVDSELQSIDVGSVDSELQSIDVGSVIPSLVPASWKTSSSVLDGGLKRRRPTYRVTILWGTQVQPNSLQMMHPGKQRVENSLGQFLRTPDT